MTEQALDVSSFASYPAEGRALAVANLDLLREMPEALLASLLREVRGFDLQFPAEQVQVKEQFAYLRGMSVSERRRTYALFPAVVSSVAEDRAGIARDPEGYIERYTASLWSTGGLDAFRSAAQGFVQAMRLTRQAQPPSMPRLAMVVVGEGAGGSSYRLFRKLRPFGTLYTQVRGVDGHAALVERLQMRAAAHPEGYAHWYIAGGAGWSFPAASRGIVAELSYTELDGMRREVLGLMNEAVIEGWGPERLRDRMAHLNTAGANDRYLGDARLQSFAISLFTQGSGTQIFSTTFVQWAAREALRRAEPLTLLCDYAPRQRQRPMNEMLETSAAQVQLDPYGSLIDADMAAWSTWLEMCRLPEVASAALVVLCQSRGQAMVVGRGAALGRQSDRPVDTRDLLEVVT